MIVLAAAHESTQIEVVLQVVLLRQVLPVSVSPRDRHVVMFSKHCTKGKAVLLLTGIAILRKQVQSNGTVLSQSALVDWCAGSQVQHCTQVKIASFGCAAGGGSAWGESGAVTARAKPGAAADHSPISARLQARQAHGRH